MTEGLVGHKMQVATPAELAAAREARGLSQIAVSQRIKLQVRQVGALEEGQWAALPGRAFVRGALRSYGKLLDVDVSPLLESIGGFAEPSQVSVMQPLDTSSSHSSALRFSGADRGSPMLWVIAGLVGVVGVIAYLGSPIDASRVRAWLPDIGSGGGASSGAGPASSSPEGATAPASADSAAPAPSTPPADGGRAGLPFNGTTAAGEAAPRESPAGSGIAEKGATAPPAPALASASTLSPSATGATSAPVAPLAPAASAAGSVPAGSIGSGPGGSASAASTTAGVVRVKAVKDAWVEVRNADGTLLHNRLVKGGSSLELKGAPPYRVVLGNASALELTFEGKPLDLKPHIQANDIARLELR